MTLGKGTPRAREGAEIEEAGEKKLVYPPGVRGQGVRLGVGGWVGGVRMWETALAVKR